MFEIVGLDHIVLRTNNLEKMVFFYCNVLGCHIENTQDELGLIQLRAGNNIIDLLKIDQTIIQAGKNLEHFCLRIYPFEFEKLKKYFHSHGIELLRYANRYGAQGYGWSFYLKDPDNNEVELVAAHKVD